MLGLILRVLVVYTCSYAPLTLLLSTKVGKNAALVPVASVLILSAYVAVVADPAVPAPTIYEGGDPVPLLDNIHPLVFDAAKNEVVPVLD